MVVLNHVTCTLVKEKSEKGIGWFKPTLKYYSSAWLLRFRNAWSKCSLVFVDWPFCLLEQMFIACYFQLCRCMWPPFFTSAFYTSLEGSTKTCSLRTKRFISGSKEAVGAIHRCSKPSGCVWNSFESHILAFQCDRVFMEIDACHDNSIHSF